VAKRETLAHMSRALDLVGHRNREILEGNPAFSVLGSQKLVGPEPELAGPLALDEEGRRGQEGPVQLLLLPEEVEEGRLSASALDRAGNRGRDQPDARRRLEAAGAADHQIAGDLRTTGGADQL